MSSKAFRIVVNGIPNMINLNHVFKVTLRESRVKVYYTAEIITDEFNFGTKAEAEKVFEEIAKLM